MYVCLCRGITDGQIREAVAGGCCNYKQVRQSLGLATQCGKCACDAKGVVRKALDIGGCPATQVSAPASLAFEAA